MVVGKGAYWGKSLGRHAGGMLGHYLGNKSFGQEAGAYLGDKGSDWINKQARSIGTMVTGRGAYNTTNNLIKSKMLNGVPQFSSSKDETGALTIRHREYVTDINATNALFEIRKFALNPGLASTFPWLSQIAASYDEYDMNGLIFTFVSTSQSSNTSNNSLGTVIMCTNYNASAGTFPNKVQMMEYDSAQSARQDRNQSHGIECDPKKSSGFEILYVRNDVPPLGQDIKAYDIGNFQLATSSVMGSGATGTAYPVQVGELWVTYNVTLRKPKLAASSLLMDSGKRGTNIAAGGNAIIFTNMTLSPARNLYGVIDTTGNLVKYFFPPGTIGNFRVNMTINYNAFATLNTNVVVQNCSLNSNNTNGWAVTYSAGAGGLLMIAFDVIVDGSSNVLSPFVSLGSVSSSGTVVNSSYVVKQVNSVNEFIN